MERDKSWKKNELFHSPHLSRVLGLVGAVGYGIQSFKYRAGQGQDSQQKVAASSSERGDEEAETSCDSKHTLLSPCTRATAQQCHPASANQEGPSRQRGMSDALLQHKHHVWGHSCMCVGPWAGAAV